jgi:hypothetical protein
MARHDALNLLSAAGAAGAIGGAYKFAEFLHKAKKLKDVGPSNAVYVRLIKRIRADLDEVKRLLTVPEIKLALEANPPKAKWVYGVMRDVRGALENITPHTERVASDIEDGRRVGLRHRVYWLVSEKEKLENREKELGPAHASLTEVIGYLTALEPVNVAKQTEKAKVQQASIETHDTKVDVDIRRGGVDRVERDVYVERDVRAPRRVVEERDVYIEHERAPRRVEHRETWVEQERGPRAYAEHGPRFEARYEDDRGFRASYERDAYVDRRDPRQEEHYYEERRYGPAPGRVEERDYGVQAEYQDPRHVEAQYYESGPRYYDEKRYEERRFDHTLPRRPESYEDRVPDRENYMQSDVGRNYSSRGPYGEYAEYGAPQPSGAAEYSGRRRFTGDPGFGDQLVLNPQPVPPQGDYNREVSAFTKYRGHGDY